MQRFSYLNKWAKPSGWRETQSCKSSLIFSLNSIYHKAPIPEGLGDYRPFVLLIQLLPDEALRLVAALRFPKSSKTYFEFTCSEPKISAVGSIRGLH